MPDGYVYMELDSATGGKLIIQRSDKPGALVRVQINDEIVHVEPTALLLAAQNVQEEI